MKSLPSKVIFVSQFLILMLITSACEIRKKGAKDDPEYGEQGKAAVASFFTLEEAAISNSDEGYQNLRSAISYLMGRALVVSDDSTFKKWYAPVSGCRSIASDLVEVSPIRSLDVGELLIQDPSGQRIEVKKDPKEFYFYGRGMLNSGSASLTTTGNKGSFVLSHTFTVPEMGAQIAFESLRNSFREKLPSPLVVGKPASVNQDIENYYVQLNRSEGYKVTYQAPAGTQFIRLTILDNPAVSTQSGVVCYAAVEDDFFIPQGTLTNLKATGEAQLTVDFVSMNLRTDIARTKESFVLSYSRHYHGRRDLNDVGINEPFYFGELILE